MKENSIEEDIKIALDKFSDNKDIDSAILIVEKFILGNYILRGGRKNIVKDSLRYILSDYKRVLKENEEWQKTYQEEKDKQFEIIRKNQELEKRWDNDTHKLQNDLDIANAKIVELQKELNQENKKCMMLAIEKQDYFEKYRYHLQQNERLTKEFSNVIPVQKVKILLNLIEKLQKEKEEYSKQLDLDYVDKNYIPIQKVKDEKEKLDKKYNELVDKVYKDPLKALTDFQRVVGGQAILNALLKEGET